MMRKSRQFSIVILASVLIALLLSSPFLWMIILGGGDRFPTHRILPLVFNLSGNFVIAMILFQLNLNWKYVKVPGLGQILKNWVVIFLINIVLAVLLGYLMKELGGFRPPRPGRMFLRYGASINIASLVAYVMLVSRLLEVLIKNQEVALENERLRSENLQNQFSALKSQLDPHFLFNSLNTVMELIEEDKQLAKGFVAKLSEVFRYMLTHSQKNLIALADEVRFVEGYVYLLQLRHSQLSLKTDLASDQVAWYVPPMAIQLLVENAVKHNEVSRQKPLQITISQVGDTLEISNPIQEKRTKADGAGMGLKNLTERYRIIADRPVHIDKRDDVFYVIIPLVKNQEL